jgi:hypothetical protein
MFHPGALGGNAFFEVEIQAAVPGICAARAIGRQQKKE